MAPRKNDGAWWDATWNTMGGCRPISAGCLNCYAARHIGTLHSSLDVALYRDTSEFKGGRHRFNGTLRELPPAHPEWTFPLRWKGAAHPLLGPGMPSLIFVGDMAEIFLPERSKAVIDRTLGTLASSDHIGLVLTKQPEQMVAYLAGQPRRWRQELWGLQRGRPSPVSISAGGRCALWQDGRLRQRRTDARAGAAAR